MSTVKLNLVRFHSGTGSKKRFYVGDGSVTNARSTGKKENLGVGGRTDFSQQFSEFQIADLRATGCLKLDYNRLSAEHPEHAGHRVQAA